MSYEAKLPRKCTPTGTKLHITREGLRLFLSRPIPEKWSPLLVERSEFLSTALALILNADIPRPKPGDPDDQTLDGYIHFHLYRIQQALKAKRESEQVPPDTN